MFQNWLTSVYVKKLVVVFLPQQLFLQKLLYYNGKQKKNLKTGQSIT